MKATEFLKRNCVHMIVAMLGLAGAILMIIQIAQTGNMHEVIRPSFMGLSVLIGYMVFFIGVAALGVSKMFNVSLQLKSYIWITIGLVSSVFFVFGIINAANIWDEYFLWPTIGQGLPASNEELGARSLFLVFPQIANLIALGLLPLAKGVTMSCRARLKGRVKIVKPVTTETTGESAEA